MLKHVIYVELTELHLFSVIFFIIIEAGTWSIWSFLVVEYDYSLWDNHRSRTSLTIRIYSPPPCGTTLMAVLTLAPGSAKWSHEAGISRRRLAFISLESTAHDLSL
jgi:hypothetical protein